MSDDPQVDQLIEDIDVSYALNSEGLCFFSIFDEGD